MCMYVTTFAMHTKPQDEWHSVGVWEHSLWNLWNIHTTRRECIKKHVYVWASSKKTRDTKERRCEWSVEWHFNIQPERKINISCSKNNEHSRAWASHDAVAIHIHLSHSFISIYSPCPCFSPFRFPNIHLFCGPMANSVTFELLKIKIKLIIYLIWFLKNYNNSKKKKLRKSYSYIILLPNTIRECKFKGI